MALGAEMGNVLPMRCSCSPRTLSIGPVRELGLLADDQKKALPCETVKNSTSALTIEAKGSRGAAGGRRWRHGGEGACRVCMCDVHMVLYGVVWLKNF